MNVQVQVIGSAEAARWLEGVAGALRTRGIKAGLLAAGLVVQNDAKRRAAWKTGTLRRSIHIGGNTGLAPDFGGGTAAYSDIGGERDDELAIGTNVPYGARIEYGYLDVDVLGRSYRQRPRPYLRPALDENHSEIAREFAGAVRDVLRRVS